MRPQTRLACAGLLALAPVLLIGACCGPSQRILQAPQAVLTVVDGEPLLGIAIEDLDRVQSDPHCGGSIDLRGAAILMIRPDASAPAVMTLRGRDLVDGPSHDEVPTLTGLGLAAPESPVAVFGDVNASSQSWSEESTAPLGVRAVADGEGLVLLTHRHTTQIPFGSETSYGVTGWSPATGVVWTHGGDEENCSVFMTVRTSPSGRFGLMNRETHCGSRRTAIAQTLTTNDGVIYGADHETVSSYGVAQGGIADDGTSLVYSRDEGTWLHRSVEGDVLSHLTNDSINPVGAFAWGDDWLVQDADGVFTRFDRSGGVLATTRVEDIRDVQTVVTNDGLWVLYRPQIPTTYCLTQYDRNLAPLEPICLDEADFKAAYDGAN